MAKSTYEGDQLALLDIFPTEIWIKILEFSSNDADCLEHVSNSSLYFREILRKQRVQFLAKRVLPVLALQQETIYNPKAWQWNKSFNNTLLNCRFVSKSWNTAIEDYYQQHKSHFQTEDDNEEIQMGDLLFRSLVHVNLTGTILNVRNPVIDHFTRTHEGTTRNPFLGRSVNIYMAQYSDIHYSNGIFDTLSIYGQHIWYCSIFIFNFADRVVCYNRLVQILTLVPSLKVLKLTYYGEKKRLSSAERNEIRQNYRNDPMPVLPHLEMIQISDLMPSVFNELLRNNYQIKKLYIVKNINSFNYRIFKVPLYNLNCLHFQIHSLSTFRKLNSEYVNWNLTTLNISFPEMDQFLDWQTVFKMLEKKFKTSLTALSLSLPEAIRKQDRTQLTKNSKGYKLSLPNVNKFTVEMKNAACLDFLLPMQSIEELEIIFSIDTFRNAVYQLEGFEKDYAKRIKLLSVEKTNIFDFFPKLRDLTYRVRARNVEQKAWNGQRE